MAKGAATEKSMGALHGALTKVFTRVLQQYESNLDKLEALENGTIEEEMAEGIMAEGLLPNPAMLGAISKFLKDNDISFEAEEINELSDLEKSLAERRKKRSTIASLSVVPRAINE